MTSPAPSASAPLSAPSSEEEQTAREAVVRAGVRLVETGLIARTWGNVSARVGDEFLITPTGRDYLTLAPEEIVPVSLADLTHRGDLKPSSEKAAHQAIYRARPDVRFVIHTHQTNASAVGACGLPGIVITDEGGHALPAGPGPAGAAVPDGAGTAPAGLSNREAPRTTRTALLGRRVLTAGYGLPSTKKLADAIARALDRTPAEGHAILMAHHGAICFGRDADEALEAALQLEAASERFVRARYLAESRLPDATWDKMRQCALSRIARPWQDTDAAFTGSDAGTDGVGSARWVSHRTGSGFAFSAIPAPPPGIRAPGSDDSTLLHAADPAALPPTASAELRLHATIYRDHPHIRAIEHTMDPDTVAVSRANLVMRPLLDDFAQIVGTSVRTISGGPAQASRALSHASAVLLAGAGALCCAADAPDAEAIRMIVEKNCRTLLWSALLGRPHLIGRADAALMRAIYRAKYSREITRNV